ncbi:hypothetical protein [Gimesia fumaroli]|uniref:Uncharacterized protein n=1 Tax=Gimesia fumaroli TaxID=2527976 RepID=A0A518IFG4_9PLAN|nr:hypothetical protein [Gimesia fumaroli]QDV51824.1 hypothetical protein Enr17x_38830 [Gimesia fumaroli]
MFCRPVYAMLFLFAFFSSFAATIFAEEEKNALSAPEVSKEFSNFISPDHEKSFIDSHANSVKELSNLLTQLQAGESASVKPINDYLAPLKRELKNIDDWFAEAVRRNPDRVVQLLKERDNRIKTVWEEFRKNRKKEYRGVRVTKSDYQHASRGPVTTPGGSRGKTERTCRVEAPSDEYTLDSANRNIGSRMGDTHVGGIQYLPRGRGCTLYLYAKAKSFGSTTRSRVGVTLIGTFRLKDVVTDSRVSSDEKWLRDRI